MNNFINSLDEKERIMLSVGLVILAGIAGYFLLYAPFSHKLQTYREEVATQKELLRFMENGAAEARQLRAAGAAIATEATTASPLAVIDQTAATWNLADALKRVEPSGPDGVRVWLEDAVFIDVVNWLQSLQKNNGIVVSECSLDSINAPGLVNARITFSN